MTPHQIKQLAEREFEKEVAAWGTGGFLTRLPDTSDIRSRFKKETGHDTYAHLPPNPADYVVTIQGRMFYAEVKGLHTEEIFRLNRIERSQMAAMIRQEKAEGEYYLFIYHLAKNFWYTIPGRFFVNNFNSEKPIATIKLKDLQQYGTGIDPFGSLNIN